MDSWFCSLSSAGLVSFLRCSEFISGTGRRLYSFLAFGGARCGYLNLGISLSCAVYIFSYVSEFGFLLNKRKDLEGTEAFLVLLFLAGFL